MDLPPPPLLRSPTGLLAADPGQIQDQTKGHCSPYHRAKVNCAKRSIITVFHGGIVNCVKRSLVLCKCLYEPGGSCSTGLGKQPSPPLLTSAVHVPFLTACAPGNAQLYWLENGKTWKFSKRGITCEPWLLPAPRRGRARYVAMAGKECLMRLARG